MSKLFSAAVSLAESITASSVDRRPDALRGLRDAEHPTCLYYRFLFELTRQMAPVDVIEIGTYVGTSAAHLACNNWRFETAQIEGQVITIDINQDAKRCVSELGIPNITAITGDSHAVVPHVVRLMEGRGDGLADILYIDGNHTFNRAWGEYLLYRPLVRDGGLMIFDDVGLEMNGDEMNVLWDTIPERKRRVDHLHPNTGFGIVEKQHMGWVGFDAAAAAARASDEIRRRRS